MIRRVLTMSRAALVGVVLLFGGATIASAQQIATTGTITANGQSVCFLTGGVTLPNGGWGTTMAQLTGTWTGTVQFQISVDATNFQSVNATPTNGSSPVTTATANGEWFISSAASRSVCVTATASMTGTVNVVLRGHPAGGAASSGGGGSSPSNTIGSPISSTVVPVGGKDGSGNAQTFKFDVSGNLLAAITGAGSGGTSSVDKITYTAGTTAGTPSMGALDDTATTVCAEDQTCIARLTAQRALHVNLRTAAGVETGIAAAPLQVSLANTATNATAVKVDGSAVTSPISAASLPLPTGAATAAKQPALGTAGAAAADVLSVQGIASGTALAISGTVTANQGGSWTVQPGNTANTTPWLITPRDSGGADATDTVNHALKVNIVAGAAAGGTSLADGGTFTVGTTNDTPISGLFETSPTTCVTGKACAIGLTAAREQKVSVTAALPAGSNALGSVTATQTTASALKATVTHIDSGGTDMTDTTNHALKVAIVADSIGSVTDIDDASIAAGQSNIALTVPLGYLYNGTAWIRPIADACRTEPAVYLPISQATSTTIITGTAAKKIFLCSIFTFGADAESVSIVEGTGTVCATGIAAVIGGTSAANGANFAANQGFVLGNGVVSIAATATAADNLCLLQSGTGRVAGVLKYVVR